VPTRPLPSNPSLKNLETQVEQLLTDVRAGTAQAIDQAREFHPHADTAIGDFSLSDAQLVTARHYGFASWPKLYNGRPLNWAEHNQQQHVVDYLSARTRKEP
jgi:hypothetical protein